MYLAVLLIATGWDRLWPTPVAPGRWGDVVGLILIVAGTAIMPPVLGRFRRAGTSFDIHKPAAVLITDGPYRSSRNPAYMALTLWYIGAGLILNNGWALLFVLPLLVVMDRGVIPWEERRLEERFGARYRDYKSTVRRWL